MPWENVQKNPDGILPGNCIHNEAIHSRFQLSAVEIT